jgi:DNA-binding NarL/FixJ family response regulator
MDLTGFAVALVVVLSSSDLDAALALARTLDTIVLAHVPNEGDARYALSAGAVGYMALSLPDTTLSNAIRSILSGDAGFSRSVIGQWLRDIGRQHGRATEPALSARQRQILERISHGDTDKEIAHRLGIATATVHKHVQRLLQRLDAPNRAAAVTHTRRRSRGVGDHARPSRAASSTGV